MKSGKVMSYAEQIRVIKTRRGMIWVLIGLLHLFDSILLGTIRLVATIACIVSIVRMERTRKENSDEMAQENLDQAKAATLDFMQMGFLWVSILAMALAFLVKESVILLDWTNILPAVCLVIYGIGELLVGVKFRKLEEA